MDQYQDLDESTLQQMVSEASSYEERAALRQALRKRKKEKGESVGRAKPRGNSVYNRFAGGTATKSSVHGGPNLVKPISTSTKNKQETVAAPPTPTESPSPQTVTPTQQPITPTPPVTPTPSAEADATPIVAEDTTAALDATAEDTTTEDATAEDTTTEDATTLEETEIEEKESVAPVEPDLGSKEEVIAAVSTEDSGNFTPDQDKMPQDSTDSVPDADLHQYLVAYVNQELFLDPPLPARGKALYDTCSDPTLLCKLINKSVPGTVDLRALSKVSGSSTQRAEALQDNMTLVVESARAIGCRIHDTTQDKILRKEPEVINEFLLDLIRARVVHMPGMEDEPSSTFTDLPSLFQKLHVSLDNGKEDKPVSWRDDGDRVSKALKERSRPSHEGSWKDTKSDSTPLTYEQRAAQRKAEREQRQKEKEFEANSVGLTYEERAAQRKAEREQRRKEREALAK